MTGIIAIVSIAALAWGAVLAYRGSVLVGSVLYVVFSCCLGAELWSWDAAGLTWTLDRFFLIALVGLFIAQALVRRTDHKPIGPGECVLAAFFLLLAASTFTHDWKTLGPDRVPVLMHLVNGYLAPAAIFWIARESALSRRDVRLTQAVLACFGAYLAFTAICEIAELWPLVFPKYIANAKIGIHFGRARGPMLQSAVLGTFLVAGLVATWVLLAWRGTMGRVGKMMPLAIAPLYLAAIAFTYTRSVWMGAGLALAVVLGLVLTGLRRNLALGGLMLAAALVLLAKGSDLVSMQRETSGEVTRESTYMRASFAYVSWQMFKDHPLAGIGFGQFARTNPYYLSDRETELHLEAIRGYVHHNSFLSVLVETGVVGLILYVWILVDWTRGGILLWRDQGAPDWMRGHALLMLATFAPFVCQLMFRDVSYSLPESALVFLLAGVTSGLRAMQARQVGVMRRVGDTGLFIPVASRPAGSAG